MRMFGGLALAVLVLAGCETKPATGPLATMPTGTAESTLRQQQLQGAVSGANPGTQNPVATGANVGTTGIVRQGDGAGTVGGNVAGQRADGSVERPGVGAPSPQGGAVTNPRRKKKSS